METESCGKRIHCRPPQQNGGGTSGLVMSCSPITKQEPTNNQKERKSDMRPGIELLAGSRGVMGRESRVEGRHHGHHARINHPSDGIRVRVTGIQESQQEPSDRTGSQRADGHMAPKSLRFHGDGMDRSRCAAKRGLRGLSE